MNISTTNPYADHPQLSTLEGEVLWEYAKLADKVKKISTVVRETVDAPNSHLLSELRELEKEMKLVFTMYRAAVYNVSQAAEMRDAENEAAIAAQEQSPQSRRTPDQSWEDEGSTIMF
ncbi:hypothetical protein CcaverHIS002_0203740 [Cutaneotrichosporon cavernicola]|uniref:DASH complex subunit DAD3 n=1 Tax=Cutaneotrichosporon cavernicola TaxID=279322 RepID=A0AA48I8G2_9TREE|nr:uncharacterized protein CcaverHIS019_0203720 [Cutaneotrichosporon cavernicola]BEI81214.1 hypothetical protein CcaverHIS002_0203740 [Cutaneotrichosporon cavernicola]BEI89010.1 hypothetical protein CcaverHIS019_0203720 [Cutaneotrichosporon cavernicola]BEI96786.1 hypothetical protein CcaverHIS631_0203750 [Cutaneotrichosporon cavernicola]BEJ04558.1 hypothetical protein CcaverHIS641_0203750 [Cutaneotrichosporon cavernicola]